MRVVAVSDQYGAVLNRAGLDLDALDRHVAENRTVVGFPLAEPLDNEHLLQLDVDALLPCAVEGVITHENAHLVAARTVVEGANGPTTPAADRILAERGVVVVPDILANAGGVIVSYFEWVQANQAYWWSETDVRERLRERMALAWNQVSTEATRTDRSLRDAATTLAVGRVAEAHRVRGLYP